MTLFAPLGHLSPPPACDYWLLPQVQLDFQHKLVTNAYLKQTKDRPATSMHYVNVQPCQCLLCCIYIWHSSTDVQHATSTDIWSPLIMLHLYLTPLYQCATCHLNRCSTPANYAASISDTPLQYATLTAQTLWQCPTTSTLPSTPYPTLASFDPQNWLVVVYIIKFIY